MNSSIFGRLGFDSLLRDTEDCVAEVSHGVEVIIPGDGGDIVAHKSVINICYTGLPPKRTDSVTVSGKTYRLDLLLKDDGYSARWVVL